MSIVVSFKYCSSLPGCQSQQRIREPAKPVWQDKAPAVWTWQCSGVVCRYMLPCSLHIWSWQIVASKQPSLPSPVNVST